MDWILQHKFAKINFKDVPWIPIKCLGRWLTSMSSVPKPCYERSASVLFWKIELGNKKNSNVSLFGLCCNLGQFSFDFPSYLLNRNQFEVFRKKNQPQNENCWTRFSEIPTRFGAGNLHGILSSRSVHFF